MAINWVGSSRLDSHSGSCAWPRPLFGHDSHLRTAMLSFVWTSMAILMKSAEAHNLRETEANSENSCKKGVGIPTTG